MNERCEGNCRNGGVWPVSPICLPMMFFFLFAGPAAIQGFLKPYFGIEHGINDLFKASLPLAVLYLVFSVSRYFAGTVMHWLGRKRCIILGALGYFLFPVSMVFFDSFGLFVLSGVVMGVSASLLWTAGSTHVLDGAIKKRLGRASGILYSAVAAGQVIGVLTMGVLARRAGPGGRYWWIFGIAAIFGAAGVILATFVPNVPGGSERPHFRYLVQFYRNPANWVMPLVACLASMPYGFVLSVLNKTAKDIAPVWGVTAILAFYYASNCVTSSVSGRISDRLGRWGTFIGCLVAAGIMLTVIGSFKATMPLLCLAGIVLGWPQGGLSPVMMAWVGDLSTPETRPTVHACAFSWRDLGVAIAMLMGGTLQTGVSKNEPVFLTFGLFFLGTGILTLLVYRLCLKHAKQADVIS